MKENREKHAYYLSTLSISLILFLLLLVCLIGYGIESSSREVVKNIQVSAILKSDIAKSEVDSLIAKISLFSDVNEAKYISKDEAAEIYKRVTGDDFSLFIDENPLPASVDIEFKSSETTKNSLEEVADLLSKEKIVAEILQSKGVIDQVLGHIYKIKLILYSFLVTLLIISTLLINNTIKLTIHSKRFLIKSMKLIGATDSFIRRPFLWASARQGFYAATIASFFIVLIYFAVNRALDIPDKGTLFAVGVIYLIVMVVGVLISVVCTFIAINRQMRQKSNQLHTY